MTLPNNNVINFILLYNSSTLVMGSSHTVFISSVEGELLSFIEIANVATIFNRISHLGIAHETNNIIIGLARLPVFIEYDISNLKTPICLRKKNLLTNKDFANKDLTGTNYIIICVILISKHLGNTETLSKFIGISCMLSMEGDDTLWIIYKDGSVEIRNSDSLEKIDSFSAHSGAMSGGLLCKLKDKQIVITLGKDDGKLILWNVKST